MRMTLTVADNTLASVIFGPCNANLERLEGSRAGLSSAGNAVTREGPERVMATARPVLKDLDGKARRGTDLDPAAAGVPMGVPPATGQRRWV